MFNSRNALWQCMNAAMLWEQKNEQTNTTIIICRNQSVLKENMPKNLIIFKTTFKFCLSLWCRWDGELSMEPKLLRKFKPLLGHCFESRLTLLVHPILSSSRRKGEICFNAPFSDLRWCTDFWNGPKTNRNLFMIQFYGLWLAPPKPSQLGHSSHFSKSHPSICQKQKQKQWTGIQGFKQEAMVNSIWMHYIYFFKFRKDKNYITSQLFIFTTK